MRNTLVAGFILAVAATGAMAQTPPAQSGPQNSAVNTSNSSNRQVDTPVKGRNSFTQGEAKSRMEKLGFSDVTGLTKDNNGVWRGQAMKDGKQVEVSLDYQGNVIEGNPGQGSAGVTDRGTPVQGSAGR
jgi:hypothetical protein